MKVTNKPSRAALTRAIFGDRIFNKPYFFLVAGVIAIRLFSLIPSRVVSGYFACLLWKVIQCLRRR